MMKRYDSYKDSGVEWIGEVPLSWDVTRVKKYFNERNEKVNDIDFPPLSVTKNGIFPQLDNVSKSDNHNDRKRVCKNDFVINSRSDRKGSSGLSQLDGSVSLINIVLEPKSINPSYSEFLFKSKDFIEEFFRNGKGIHWDLWSTRYSELQNIKIPIPPLSEQQQIVSFLDTKTSLIDSLIEKTQRKIELLKEKRTSLINEVVTKGLNPNVEMKDSGVEWIREIPSHWKKTKHKFNLSILSGYPFKSELFDNSEGFPLIRIRDISSGKIETYYQGEVLDKFVVKKGDLLIGMDGDFNTRWWDSEQGLLNQRCCSIFEGSDVLRRYLHYILPIELNIINDLTYYTTVKHLSVDDINNTDTILPPLSEQQQIVDYLDEQTQLIDKTISIEEKRIELLKEYRQSLISEVVTGKLKVTTDE